MTTPRTDKFTCAACRQEFDSGLTEEEARAQFALEFPHDTFDPTMPKVCDDCFEAMDARGMKEARLSGPAS